MPLLQPVKVGDAWGAFSFTDGLVMPSVNVKQEPWAYRGEQIGLDQEFRRNPEAVLNRLARLGRWQEAEALWDRYIIG